MRLADTKRLYEALSVASPLDSKKDVVSNTIAQIGNILESIGLFTPGQGSITSSARL